MALNQEWYPAEVGVVTGQQTSDSSAVLEPAKSTCDSSAVHEVGAVTGEQTGDSLAVPEPAESTSDSLAVPEAAESTGEREQQPWFMSADILRHVPNDNQRVFWMKIVNHATRAFNLVRMLGVGGAAVVWDAVCKRTFVECTVKISFPQGPYTNNQSQPSYVEVDVMAIAAREKFVYCIGLFKRTRERHGWSKIRDVEGGELSYETLAIMLRFVVDLGWFGLVTGQWHTSEFGYSLCVDVDECQQFELRLVQEYMAKATAGLRELHTYRKPIMHSDVKNWNILFNVKTSRLVLIDFNLARKQAAVKFPRGTAGYRAPECLAVCDKVSIHDSNVIVATVVLPEHAFIAADIWAMGVTALQLVIGRVPFASTQAGADVLDLVRPEEYEAQDVLLKDIALAEYKRWSCSPAEAEKPGWLRAGLLERGLIPDSGAVRVILDDAGSPFWQLLEGMMAYNALNRFTCHDCLLSKFLKDTRLGQ
eukprot:3848554-Rhodomonas_salina.1